MKLPKCWKYPKGRSTRTGNSPSLGCCANWTEVTAMENKRLQEVQKLFIAALEREESEQTAFLDEACGQDEDLRREVESLLVYRGEAEDFIELPALGLVAKMVAESRTQLDGPDPLDFDMTGATVSHYRIIRRSGKGGMGVIYKAEDIKLGRFVALKFLSDAGQSGVD